RPDDRLHVPGLERLVVVLEVDPPRLPGDVVLPLARVAQHRLAALLVEGVDAHLVDLGLVGDAQQPLGLQLGGQAVGVPPEPALDPAAQHRLEPRHDVLDVPGEQVAVVRQPVRERRPVVEDELVGAVLPRRAGVDRGLEGAVRLPVGKDVVLELGQARRGDDALVRRRGGGAGVAVARVAARGHRGPSGCGVRCGFLDEDDPPDGDPRYHLACPARPWLGRWDHSSCGCDGPAPSGSTERRSPAPSTGRRLRCRSSGGSPVMAGSTPVPDMVPRSARGHADAVTRPSATGHRQVTVRPPGPACVVVRAAARQDPPPRRPDRMTVLADRRRARPRPPAAPRRRSATRTRALLREGLLFWALILPNLAAIVVFGYYPTL